MKYLLGQIFLSNFEKGVRFWVYTEAGPPLGPSVTGIYYVTMLRVADIWTQNSCHIHRPKPSDLLLDFVLRQIKLTVVFHDLR